MRGRRNVLLPSLFSAQNTRREAQAWSRRDLVQAALQAGLWASVGGSTLLAPLVHAFGKIPRELPPGKSIYDLQGNVRVDGQSANEDTFIKADALVETGSNSYVIFVIGKDAHILRENSRVQFEGEGVLESALRLVTGKLLSVFGKRQADEPSHKLLTTTATIGIRGTGVYAESEPDYSYLCTCYGEVNINAMTALEGIRQSEVIVSQHHDAPRYILQNPDGGRLIVPAPVKNHTDEELLLIETLVGRTTPFSSIRSYKGPRRGY